jgi:5'(3')-deoxyribonucleotidase
MSNTKGTGRRYNNGKNRMNLFPPWAYEKICEVYTKGADKYTILDQDGNIEDSGDNNWMNGMEWSKVMGCLERHYNAFKQGYDYDYDPKCKGCLEGNCSNHTGLDNLAHLAWNAIALLEFRRIYPQGDDRLKSFLNMPKIGLDIDEVLCSWVDPWCDKFNLKKPAKSWFFDRQLKERFAEMKKEGTLDEFYLSLPAKIIGDDLPFEPHCYITSRPVDVSISEKWLDDHGFPCKPVYCVGSGQSKVDVALKSGIDIFVDDFYDNFVDLNNAGIFTYLFDAPHNQKYNVGYHRIKSLNDIPLVK